MHIILPTFEIISGKNIKHIVYKCSNKKWSAVYKLLYINILYKEKIVICECNTVRPMFDSLIDYCLIKYLTCIKSYK